MIGKPKYAYNDKVEFFLPGVGSRVGTIKNVDAYGVIEDDSEVYYDILVEYQNTLYKHIKETYIHGK